MKEFFHTVRCKHCGVPRDSERMIHVQGIKVFGPGGSAEFDGFFHSRKCLNLHLRKKIALVGCVETIVGIEPKDEEA